jgi:hypothetical protein
MPATETRGIVRTGLSLGLDEGENDGLSLGSRLNDGTALGDELGGSDGLLLGA